MMNFIKKLWYNQGLRYLFFGGCTTLVNLVIFNVLVYTFHINYTVSNIISVIAAILFAYAVNKLFVFSSSCSTWKEVFLEFYGGVYVLVQFIGQAKWLAKLETQVIVVIVNYFISKFLVFKHTQPERD